MEVADQDERFSRYNNSHCMMISITRSAAIFFKCLLSLTLVVLSLIIVGLSPTIFGLLCCFFVCTSCVKL